MAKRRKTPQRPTSFVANAAIVISSAFLGLPAAATTDNLIPCPATERATLSVAEDALSVTTLSHDVDISKDAKTVRATLLAPRAEAAIRDAFDDDDVEASPSTATPPMAESADDSGADDVKPMITRLPGVSDDELSRFRKQMFRRDI